MTHQQARVVLGQVLAALFPYSDPRDDPNRQRALDQKQATEALATLVSAIPNVCGRELETSPINVERTER